MKKDQINLFDYNNPDLPLEARVDDLLKRLNLEEKISQMVYYSSAISRLGIPEYNWWNECLHGVARAGVATVFPQAIGLAAAFHQERLQQVAEVIADEARAKYNQFTKHEDRGIYKGLTFWTPNINIFRDPRWGRGQETYGEDPFLTSRLAVAFINGLQGSHPHYLKAAACAKHYAVHSGPEPLRHSFNAEVSVKDLRETYLPAFAAAVKEAKVEAVMGAYNRVNGEPACAHQELLVQILREEWGFAGHVVSDCGAIEDIHKEHRVTATPEESAALAVNNGCDLNCGRIFESLRKAVDQGLISEETIDQAVRRLLRTRFKLGMFDPPDRVPFNNIPFEINDCAQHRELAREMARESIVLLKNEDNLLPLNQDKLSSIAVIGPNADSKKVLLGNYYGRPSRYITALEGIQNKVGAQTRVYYAHGCDLSTQATDSLGELATSGFAEALAAAERSDLIILFMGISPELEGEEVEVANSDGGGDKTSLNLPGMQENLIKIMVETGKPVVLVLLNGSPLAVNWAQENVPAIIEAWYPGQEGGTAIADVLFGDYNPAGRLPVTFARSLEQVPDFKDYSMCNRTYRYMEAEPLYPFGFGLSYTSFNYTNLALNIANISTEMIEEIKVTVEVENSGEYSGDEVVQLYTKDVAASGIVPVWQLNGFQRVNLQPGEKKKISFALSRRQLALIDQQGRCWLEPGKFKIYVGGQQPDQRSELLSGKKVLATELEVTGTAIELAY